MRFLPRALSWAAFLGYGICGLLILVFLLPGTGWRALNVLTGSMKPAIAPGDLVLVQRVPLRILMAGDVITYINPANLHQTITHRYVSRQLKDGTWWVTAKGDANPSADLPFVGGRIVGRAVLVLPRLGAVTSFLRQPLALAALVVVPGLIVIWFELRRLRQAWAMPRNTAPASPPKLPEPPQAPPPPPPAHRPRPVVHLAILPAIMLILALTGSTLAQTNRVTLAGNTLMAMRVTPSPTPHPAPSPSCALSNSTSVVSITQSNNQTAQSGSVSSSSSNTQTGNVTSGSASNTNSSTTNISINNGCHED